MPLFVQADTYIVTFRQYEFNAEYIDGTLELLADDESCSIVAHHPNKKFGYDVGTIKKVSAKVGWEEVETLGHFNSEIPARVYYELIPDKYYDLYITNKAFSTSKSLKIPVKVDNKIVEIIKDKIELPSSETPKISPKPLTGSIGPRLVRDSQKPLYVYKSPNKKYGV